MVLFLLSTLGTFSNNHTDNIAERIGRRVESRLEQLEEAAGQTDLRSLPEDFVVYRYENDSLVSWHNQFPVLNDDISARLEIQKLTSLKNRLISPLSEVTEKISFMNLGPKWYLVKSIDTNNGKKTIAGMEIQNTLIRDLYQSGNGVNSHLGLSDRFTILPLHHSEGSAVMIKDTPLFKVVENSTTAMGPFSKSLLRWLALLFLTIRQEV